MSTKLNKREVEILECLALGWTKGDCPLYGGLSYSCVMELLRKLGANEAADSVEEHIDAFAAQVEALTEDDE